MATSSAGRQFVTWRPLAALLIVLLPAVSAAQEPVKSFDQLDTRLKAGDTVWVTDARGREVRGQIQSLSPDALTLNAGGSITFGAGDVRVIHERQHDSLKNGALIGGCVFGGLVLFGCLATSGREESATCAGAAAFNGAIGAARSHR